ncbi:glycerol dehydratase reactivase beta/small subunit family protein [Modestobacter altitudinis]|uniref:glycerol dehydratase reactivase beta/small subunit family protein n=1 Tax=Modestobacter altitudinis TaxID=2213158 RepID=UPI00110CB565|nr:glycerol dehydratase reactivase beta/small subunit family protein [Modestobacter altitudinis]
MSRTDEPPAVLVYRHPGAPPAVVREVCAGVEEEGVPAEVVDAPDGLTATGLAHAAAQASRLEVGIGVDAAGAAAVHHGKLPLDHPPATLGADAPAPDRRRIGRTGARVVKNLPLG